jgi:hypothetical protein
MPMMTIGMRRAAKTPGLGIAAFLIALSVLFVAIALSIPARQGFSLVVSGYGVTATTR